MMRINIIIMESLVLLGIASICLIHLTCKFFKQRDLWYGWLGVTASCISSVMFGINLGTYINFG